MVGLEHDSSSTGCKVVGVECAWCGETPVEAPSSGYQWVHEQSRVCQIVMDMYMSYLQWSRVLNKASDISSQRIQFFDNYLFIHCAPDTILDVREMARNKTGKFLLVLIHTNNGTYSQSKLSNLSFGQLFVDLPCHPCSVVSHSVVLFSVFPFFFHLI